MADIETRVDNLETKVTTLEQQVSTVMTKLDMFIAESREARQRQDADIRELRQRQDAAQVKHDADMKEMLPALDRLRERVNTLTIINLLGYATIVVAVYLK